MSTSYESAFHADSNSTAGWEDTRSLSDSLETTTLALLTMGHPEPGEVFGWTAMRLCQSHTRSRIARSHLAVRIARKVTRVAGAVRNRRGSRADSEPGPRGASREWPAWRGAERRRRRNRDRGSRSR